LPCALLDDGDIHYLGHRTGLDTEEPGSVEYWATTSRDWQRWAENHVCQHDRPDKVAEVDSATGGIYVFGPVSASGHRSPIKDRRVHTLDLSGKDLL